MFKLAVVGNPVSHSLSPFIHREFAKQFNLEISYEAIEAPLDHFQDTIYELQQSGTIGCNVTLPFKKEAFLLADETSILANKGQAANCLVFKKHQKIYADNTDGIGLVKDLSTNLQYDLAQKKILLIGAGGAARGILYALLQKKPALIRIANRTLPRALELASLFSGDGPVIGGTLTECPEAPYDLIINATSSGHTGFFPKIPGDVINENSWCYDVCYGKVAHSFLSWCKRHQAQHVFDGSGMLVEQAAYSFARWFGYFPKTQLIREKIKNMR